MRHGSLFSGIGGFDLAAEWMGWENIFHCEWNEFGQQVLKHYWPQAISYHDITKTDFTIHRGQIDILTGGFPCQPYSLAGKRKGKEDERHLWPEMLRAIREIKPTWVVGENVFGLVNWSDGLVFEEVCAQLEAEGYEVQPFILPAAGVNAPHKRDRVWFVANSKGSNAVGIRGINNTRWQDSAEVRAGLRDEFSCNGSEGLTQNTVSDGCLCREFEQDGTEDGQFRYACAGDCNGVCGNKVARVDANARCIGQKRRQKPGSIEEIGAGYNEQFAGFRELQCWEKFPTQSAVCPRNDGVSTELDGITFSKWRNETIKAAGNAIVPQVALQIFKPIQDYETNKPG